MLVHIEVEVFESIFRYEDIQRVRQAAGAMVKHAMSTGKVVNAGVFADGRSLFFQANLNSTEDVYDLISPWANDCAHVRVRPILPIDKFGDLMQKISQRDIK